MFCPKCGDKIEQNEFYCNKCGNYLGKPNLTQNNNNYYNPHISKKNNTKWQTLLGISAGVFVLLLLLTGSFVINGFKERYYFSSDDYNEKQNTNSTTKTGKYSTIIVADNVYSGVKISTKDDAYDLIESDSVKQKDNCPSEIKKVENEIINKYGITAVNLCEIDVDFAKEISNVFKKIYDEYPSVRGYLTNLTLINTSLSDSYIAAFMPMFTFATSSSTSSYPWVIKTQVVLNSSYFLNEERLEIAIKDSSSTGHFPPNASKYSPVAHELGHYLSFLSMMKDYNLDSILMIDDTNINPFYMIYSDFNSGNHSLSMITEAYNNYKKDIGTTLTLDEWRAQISAYAVAKNNSGEYIYDETIAEAFHDVYINGKNANNVSKYVVDVLKSKLEG